MGTNTFKNGQSASITTQTTVYTAPVGKTAIALELDIANTAGTTASVDVVINDSSAATQVYLVKGTNILPGSSMKCVSGQKIVLDGSDSIQVSSDVTVDCMISVLEDVN